MMELLDISEILFGKKCRYIWTFPLWFWLYIYYFDKSWMPLLFLGISTVLVPLHQATIDYQSNKVRGEKVRNPVALTKLVRKNVLNHLPTFISIILMSILYFLTIIIIVSQYFTEPLIGYALFFVGVAGLLYLVFSFLFSS